MTTLWRYFISLTKLWFDIGLNVFLIASKGCQLMRETMELVLEWHGHGNPGRWPKIKCRSRGYFISASNCFQNSSRLAPISNQARDHWFIEKPSLVQPQLSEWPFSQHDTSRAIHTCIENLKRDARFWKSGFTLVNRSSRQVVGSKAIQSKQLQTRPILVSIHTVCSRAWVCVSFKLSTIHHLSFKASNYSVDMCAHVELFHFHCSNQTWCKSLALLLIILHLGQIACSVSMIGCICIHTLNNNTIDLGKLLEKSPWMGREDMDIIDQSHVWGNNLDQFVLCCLHHRVSLGHSSIGGAQAARRAWLAFQEQAKYIKTGKEIGISSNCCCCCFCSPHFTPGRSRWRNEFHSDPIITVLYSPLHHQV